MINYKTLKPLGKLILVFEPPYRIKKDEIVFNINQRVQDHTSLRRGQIIAVGNECKKAKEEIYIFYNFRAIKQRCGRIGDIPHLLEEDKEMTEEAINACHLLINEDDIEGYLEEK